MKHEPPTGWFRTNNKPGNSNTRGKDARKEFCALSKHRPGRHFVVALNPVSFYTIGGDSGKFLADQGQIPEIETAICRLDGMQAVAPQKQEAATAIFDLPGARRFTWCTAWYNEARQRHSA